MTPFIIERPEKGRLGTRLAEPADLTTTPRENAQYWTLFDGFFVFLHLFLLL
jgi:hypothetical protein